MQLPPLTRQLQERFLILDVLRHREGVVVARVLRKGKAGEVVLKVFRASLAREGERSRFRREAKALASIEHPHVVRLLEWGEDIGGNLYIVQEKVEGETLEAYLARHQALGVAASIDLLLGILSALSCLHGRGFVHRDVAPINVIVSRGGFPRLIDLGILLVANRLPDETRTRLTATDVILGTPAYMAPERIIGVDEDERSDIYSSGLLLYECLTGHPGVRGTSVAEILEKQVNETPPPPSHVVPSIPGHLDFVVMKAIEKDPDKRYPTARAFTDALCTARDRLDESLGAKGVIETKPTERRPFEDEPILKGARFGSYLVGSAIGAGGMGTVYRAEHEDLKRPCALKVLRKLPDEGFRFRERFIREGKILAELSHPNLVRCYDAGDEAGIAWLAMELVRGDPLHVVLYRLGALRVPEALWIAVQLLDALACLHERDLVHRDVKPANLMVTDEGVVKLMDLGLAFDPTRTRLTEMDDVLGTLPYMAPEMIHEGEVDCRSDLFQWGLILWEALAGRGAFGQQELAQLIRARASHDIPSLAKLGVEVPASLNSILQCCLLQDRTQRYPSASALRSALKPVLLDCKPAPGRLSSEEIGLAPHILESWESAARDENIRSARREASHGPGGRRFVGLVALIACLVLLAAWAVRMLPRRYQGTRGTVRFLRTRLWGTGLAVDARAGPRERLSWSLRRQERILRQGRLVASAQGDLSLKIRGLREGEKYEITLVGEEGGTPKTRSFILPRPKVIRGPYLRCGPGFVEILCCLDAPGTVTFRLCLAGKKGGASVKRSLRPTDTPYVLFDEFPRVCKLSRSLDVSLLHDGRSLAFGSRQYTAPVVFLAGRFPNDEGEMRRIFGESISITEDQVIASAKSGVITALDRRALNRLKPGPDGGLAWLYRRSPQPCYLTNWKEKLLVTTHPHGKLPATLLVLDPQVRADRFRGLCAGLGLGDLRWLVDNEGERVGRLLDSDPFQSLDPAAGERAFDLDLVGFPEFSPVVCGDEAMFALRLNDRSAVAAVDLASGRVRESKDFLGEASASVFPFGKHVLHFIGAGDWGPGKIVFLRRADLSIARTIPLDGLGVVSTPLVDPSGEFAYLTDQAHLYRLRKNRSAEEAKSVDPRQGEWRVSAKGAFCTPVRYRDRLVLPLREDRLRAVIVSAVPSVAIIDPAQPGGQWRRASLPLSAVDTYHSTRVFALPISRDRLNLFFGFTFFRVRLPDLRLEAMIPMNRALNCAPAWKGKDVYAVAGSGTMSHIALEPLGEEAFRAWYEPSWGPVGLVFR